jgi:hypothetical protein
MKILLRVWRSSVLYFTVQFGLAFLCGLIATWRVYIPNDTIARVAFGAAIGIFVSTWIASFTFAR